MYDDGAVGPEWVTTIDVTRGRRMLVLEGRSVALREPRRFQIDLLVDGRPLVERCPVSGEGFCLQVPLDGVAPGVHELTVRSSAFVVPRQWTGKDDDRPVSFSVMRLECVAEQQQTNWKKSA